MKGSAGLLAGCYAGVPAHISMIDDQLMWSKYWKETSVGREAGAIWFTSKSGQFLQSPVNALGNSLRNSHGGIASLESGF
jgi:hypothetical protein